MTRRFYEHTRQTPVTHCEWGKVKKGLKVAPPKRRLRPSPNAHSHTHERAHLRADGGFLGFQLALVGNAGGLLFAEVDVPLGGGLVEPPLAVGTLDVV